MEGITPETNQVEIPVTSKQISQADLDTAIASLNEPELAEVDFVSLGCPHLTIHEIALIANRLKGKKVVKEFWVTTARPVKQISDQMGFTQIIEDSGAKFAADTCCVVAPIRERFKVMATDSAKACYYANSKNKFKTVFKPFEQVISEALGENG
jgi:predicted aconitase